MEKKSFLEKDPMINVISKEEFEERVQKVFHLLWETLSKSFGPYGAPTLIYKYPYSHVTKDGYTIMKNLSFVSSGKHFSIKSSALLGVLNNATTLIFVFLSSCVSLSIL